VICGVCGRRLEGQGVHGRVGYRCRHGYTSGGDVRPDRAKILYLREEQVLAEARRRLAHHPGVDPQVLDGGELGRQLRWRGYTILCTPVSITCGVGEETARASTDVAAPRSGRAREGEWRGRVLIAFIIRCCIPTGSAQ
jgi:site-specific DNA recombinase